MDGPVTFDHTTAVLDPRIRRTRQMLREALQQLLATRSIEEISVADVANQSTLNRATFYDHYTDKFALLEDLIDARFQHLILTRGIRFDGTCPSALKNIALAACHYLVSLPSMDCPNRRQMEKTFESAIISVMRDMILAGLKRHPPKPPLASELVAATIAGAIYSGAREWVRTSQRGTAEEAVQAIFALVAPMLTAT